MKNAAIASAALMATSALAQGTAYVVNSCSYSVYLSNTPSAGGGFTEIDKVLGPGDGYSQQWTQLSNANGWSLKLSKTDSYQTNILQYEYTYHDDGTIWYDLSEVDGNPWNGNWMITASGSCNPKQQAYRYSTDDAYGMQACPDSSSITVTLCSGDSDAGSGSSAEPSSEAPTTTAPAPTSAASSVQSATTPVATSTGGWGSHTWQADKKGVNVAAVPSPTTLVTSQLSISSAGGYDVTVTNVATQVVTAYVTATAPAAAKRHEHHARHPHQRREE